MLQFAMLNDSEIYYKKKYWMNNIKVNKNKNNIINVILVLQ